jgi:dTDP-4-dehydrorhamnose 3,5-epimerase
MSRLTIQPTTIGGLRVVQRHPIGDQRGYLERLFCEDELRVIMGDRRIVQINHTLTAKAGTVRGMHFQQPPHAELKLVSCLRGKVFDVAVDLRQGSPTFLHWHAELLSAENHKTMAIPEGFAHGFQALDYDCELLYLHTSAYQPSAESALNALDPRIAIDWPLPLTERSARDQAHPFLADDFAGISA